MLRRGFAIGALALLSPVARAEDAASATAGMMHLTDVTVAADASTPAPAMPGWHPAPDQPSGLVLVHAEGQPLDGRWIRQQFAANAMIGSDTGFDRIAALVQLINLAFINNGYANSGLLIDSRSDAGVLRLRLVTGHLADATKGADPVTVKFRGGKRNGLDADFIRHRMPSALAVPMNVRALERDFRLLSDDPAVRTVNANLVPGGHPGEASLVLDVDPQSRVDVYATYANSRSPSVGGERLGIGGFVRSWHQPGDLLTVQYGTTSGLTDFGASYGTPLFGPKWSLTVRGGFNNAAVVDAPLVPLDIRSKEFYAEGGINRIVIAKPLMPDDRPGQWRPALTASFGVLLVHRKVESTLLGLPFSFSPGSRDGRTEYNAVRATFDYSRRSLATVLAISATGTLGLGGTRSSPPGAVTPSTHFTSAQLQVNYARRISPDLLELRLRFAGQVAGGLLYSPERMSIGGTDTVRGYRESLILADEAAVASIELAQPVELAGRRAAGEGFRWGSFTLSLFADGAVAHNRAAPQPLPKTVASLGGKAVWHPADWLTASASYGHALNSVQQTGQRDLQDRGVSFQITLHPIGLARALGGIG